MPVNSMAGSGPEYESSSTPEALLGLRRFANRVRRIDSRDDIETAESKIFGENSGCSLFDDPEMEDDQDD